MRHRKVDCARLERGAFRLPMMHDGEMTCAQQTPVPGYVRACHQVHVDSQYVRWRPTPFRLKVLRDHPALLADLEAEVGLHRGITRSFVKSREDPIELFLAMMAWGGAWRSAQIALLDVGIRAAETRARITEIIRLTRDHGAGEGWSALYLPQTAVPGLRASFGTKLLYFAGYGRTPGEPASHPRRERHESSYGCHVGGRPNVSRLPSLVPGLVRAVPVPGRDVGVRPFLERETGSR